VKAVLLDIEGTTTPLSFVLEVLFPYARKHLRDHLEHYQMSAEHRVMIDRLRDEHRIESSRGENVPPWSAVSYCEWLMDRDRKSTALKAIQGKIWEEGYAQGELTGEVFDDVPVAFERWHAEGVSIGIFSSGSVLAQQLLFRHSTAGDLTRYLRWYFDTTTGAKTEAESYRRIAAAMTLDAGDVVFVSDVTREVDAARDAGMQTRLAMRPGNAPVADHNGHAVIRTLADVEALTPLG
jgi:enolase-phosphatase E1